jgi:uncharacterized protein YjbI with pentapeptide repeats
MTNFKMIGNKIAEARKKVRISQAQLAEQLFISSQAVGKWERGESMPDIATFNRLAEILGVDLNYFSERFHSDTIETTVSGSVDEQDELVPGNKIKKLNWDMSRGNWTDADFSGLENLHEKFNTSNMIRCRFNGSKLTGLLLKGNNVDSCDFSGSDLSNSHIQRSNLKNDIFKDCSLRQTRFSGSNIEGCDFSGADFNDAEFSKSFIYGCHLTGADFSGAVIKQGGLTGAARKSANTESNTIHDAVWNHTSFKDIQIADLLFTGTLEDCYFENCEFTRVIFRNVKLTNTFFKNNEKLKRVGFINCQADRMTYEFLKIGKADLTDIKMITV